MTDDEIFEMAREVGLWVDEEGHITWGYLKSAMKLAQLIASKEREACAQVCDAEATVEGIAQRCAVAIRARNP